jgi:hypothetical protein
LIIGLNIKTNCYRPVGIYWFGICKSQLICNFNAILHVLGGFYKDGSNLNSVELLFLNDYEKYNSGWKVGPNIPLWLDGSAMIDFQNGVILIGGRGEGDGRHLFKLSSPNGTWTEMKQTLKEPRSHFVSFLVPDELVNCH